MVCVNGGVAGSGGHGKVAACRYRVAVQRGSGPGPVPGGRQGRNSLLDAGLYDAATAYWEDVSANSVRILGSDHPDTLTARANLAAYYWQARRTHGYKIC